MTSVQDLLRAAGVRHSPYGSPPAPRIYLTAANQLIGTFSDLKRFQSSAREYLRWQAHHVVECQDFGRLGVKSPIAPREQELCVLLPERAHVGRVNSVLRTANPSGVTVNASQLRSAYQDAYAMIGDYTGGGEANIARELRAIVDATFRGLGI